MTSWLAMWAPCAVRNALTGRRLKPPLTGLDVNAVLGDVAHLVRADASRRQVTLTLELTPDLPPVNGDRVHLQQVMLNMISNGMDAIGELPSPQLRLVIRTARSDDGSVEISVVDSGGSIRPRSRRAS